VPVQVVLVSPAMPKRLIFVLLLAALGTLGFFPRYAAAQQSDAGALQELEQRKRDAKDRFLRGIELTQAEKWDAALAEFLASRDLYPTKVALKNAAIALRQLGRHAEALEMYRELQREFTSSIDPKEKKELDEAMAQVRENVGEIDVESDQKESTVVIDGQQRGTTPLSDPILVTAGTHSVRIAKEGFETFEAQVLVAGKQRKLVKAKLEPLAASGTLIVREASGKSLEVLVDGALVGKTPWQGRVAPGARAVLLRGEGNLGTAPSAAKVRLNETTTLTLRAIELNSELRIEPTPTNATLFLDGVELGSGVWEGRLQSGGHKVEAVAEGFIALRRNVTLAADQREVLQLSLERDLSDPMWTGGFVPHLYAELVGGGLWSPSFGGSADAACRRGDCSERTRPLGFIVGARGGYAITRALGAEVFLGYLQVKGSMTRTQTASVEGVPVVADDYEDTTSLAGPMAALSASYRFFDKTPLTFRIWGGAARLTSKFSNQGTFDSEPLPPLGCQPPDPCPLEPQVLETSVSEKSANIWVPVFGPEVRFGYQVSDRFGVDFGVAVLLMFPPKTEREGRAFSGRSIPVETPRLRGLLALPQENGFGTFFLIAPTLAGRFDF
jgi:hypothetical protein